MRSSYKKNGYGEVFYREVLRRKPRKAVELGILHGYSTLHIATALKELHATGEGYCCLESYDLFEKYPYRHGNQQSVNKMLNRKGVSGYVQVIQGDAFEVQSNYTNGDIDFLHVDLSNTGEVVRHILELWHPKMSSRGVIVFEGGSEERDKIDWMVKYNKPPIREELFSNRIISAFYLAMIIQPFPSMTILTRL